MSRKGNSSIISFIVSILCLIVSTITIIYDKIDISINDKFVYIILVVFAFVMLFLVTFILSDTIKTLRERKNGINDIQENLAKYDKVREHLENEIINLQNNLINNQLNWEEINHLPISAQIKGYTDESIKETSFTKRFGLSNKDLEIDKKMVFYLTPFSTNYVETYNEVKSICNESGLSLYRGDEEFAHDILFSVVRYIVKSRIIIVNIDGKNPNVFYEMGIAHALGKPTILISKCIAETPFDIQNNRIIIYSDFKDLDIKLTKELSKILIDN